jgi:hypothetical protein
MKRYNYKTKKIYESVSVFNLSLDEFDANGKLTDSKYFEDTYSTLEDAIEDAYDIMTNVAKNDNIDEDDVVYDENGNTVTFTVDGIGKWVFTVESSQYECDNSVSECDENKSDDNSYSKVNYSDNEDNANESVAERFARLRKMFESDDDSNDEPENDGGESDDTSDENSEEDKDEEMKAVIITVKKGDEDKCKDELIDAGISEDDIEILEADEDADNIDIRIDVNSVMELKDYLSKKGIDLEEEIGGEIVSDEDSENDNEENDDENKEGDDEEEFDFDNLGDIFGAEDEEQ